MGDSEAKINLQSCGSLRQASLSMRCVFIALNCFLMFCSLEASVNAKPQDALEIESAKYSTLSKMKTFADWHSVALWAFSVSP